MKSTLLRIDQCHPVAMELIVERDISNSEAYESLSISSLSALIRLGVPARTQQIFILARIEDKERNARVYHDCDNHPFTGTIRVSRNK